MPPSRACSTGPSCRRNGSEAGNGCGIPRWPDHTPRRSRARRHSSVARRGRNHQRSRERGRFRMRRRIILMTTSLSLAGCAAWPETAPPSRQKIVIKTVVQVVERPVVVERVKEVQVEVCKAKQWPPAVSSQPPSCPPPAQPAPAQLPPTQQTTTVTQLQFDYCRRLALEPQCKADPACGWISGFENEGSSRAERVCLPRAMTELPLTVLRKPSQQ